MLLRCQAHSLKALKQKILVTNKIHMKEMLAVLSFMTTDLRKWSRGLQQILLTRHILPGLL